MPCCSFAETKRQKRKTMNLAASECTFMICRFLQESSRVVEELSESAIHCDCGCRQRGDLYAFIMLAFACASISKSRPIRKSLVSLLLFTTEVARAELARAM